jgi:hypothetical protein
MGRWSRVVNALVVAFALFFAFIGFGLLYFGVSGQAISGTDVEIEGGPGWDKIALGLIFLLAAAPMFYYVFSPTAKGLPEPPKRGPKPPQGDGKPPT